MNDKTKKIIKYSVILTCVVVVVIATIVLQALNKSPVFAESIFAKSSVAYRSSKSTKFHINDFINIMPANYNQGLEYKSDNSKVEVNTNGEINFLENEYLVTITVFAKSSNDKKVFTSFKIILEDYVSPSIEKDLIKFDCNNVGAVLKNKLVCPKDSVITVSSLNNLASFDYNAGIVKVDSDLSKTIWYDKIKIDVITSGRKTELDFEVIIVQNYTYSLNDEYCVITFKNTLTNRNEYLNFNIQDESVIKYEAHRDSDVTLIFVGGGNTSLEIYCSQFRYIIKITITN